MEGTVERGGGVIPAASGRVYFQVTGGGKGWHDDRKRKSGGRNAVGYGHVMLIGSRRP